MSWISKQTSIDEMGTFNTHSYKDGTYLWKFILAPLPYLTQSKEGFYKNDLPFYF